MSESSLILVGDPNVLDSAETCAQARHLIICCGNLGNQWVTYPEIQEQFLLLDRSTRDTVNDPNNSSRNMVSIWNDLVEKQHLGVVHRAGEGDGCHVSVPHRVCIRKGKRRAPGKNKGKFLQEHRIEPTFAAKVYKHYIATDQWDSTGKRTRTLSWSPGRAAKRIASYTADDLSCPPPYAAVDALSYETDDRAYGFTFDSDPQHRYDGMFGNYGGGTLHGPIDDLSGQRARGYEFEAYQDCESILRDLDILVAPHRHTESGDESHAKQEDSEFTFEGLDLDAIFKEVETNFPSTESKDEEELRFIEDLLAADL